MVELKFLITQHNCFVTYMLITVNMDIRVSSQNSGSVSGTVSPCPPLLLIIQYPIWYLCNLPDISYQLLQIAQANKS